MNTKEEGVIPDLPLSSVTSAPTVHPIIYCLDFRCLLGWSSLTCFSLPIFFSHCSDSVHELGKWLSGQASVSTSSPQNLLNSRDSNMHLGGRNGVLSRRGWTTSLRCIKRSILNWNPHMHAQTEHTQAHMEERGLFTPNYHAS